MTTPAPTPSTTEVTPPTTAVETPSLLNEGTAAEQKPAETTAAAETPEQKAEREAAEATKLANDTTKTPFKAEEIKFSSPDISVDPKAAETFVGLVNKFGIPRDAVAELVALQEQTMKAASEANSALWNGMQDTWRQEVAADPVIGGTKQQETLGAISKLVDQFGTPELRQAFDLTGAGNNPHVIRFLAKVAKELGEPGRVISGAPSVPEKSLAERLFPNQGKS